MSVHASRGLCVALLFISAHCAADAASAAESESVTLIVTVTGFGSGVGVLALAPGPVATGFGARAGLGMGGAARPEDLVEPSLHALGRGGTLRPGGLAKLLGYSLALMPRPLRVLLMRRIMAGMIASASSPAVFS